MYKKYTVLFVDDEINIQSSIRRLMMDEEFTSVFASSGKEAIDIIGKNNISVIVTDMRMPEMNGLELLKKVEVISPLTVKLVLSGYTQIPQILATVNEVDIYKFISKPWDADDLVSIVKKSLDYYIIKEEHSSQKKILEAQNKAYKNILAKIKTVISNAKNSNEIICRCGTKIIGFGSDFAFKEREMFKDVFEIQGELFTLISKGITFEESSVSLDIFIENLSRAVLPILSDVKISSKSDLTTIINTNVKILETAISAAALVFHKEFSFHGLVISVENVEEFNVVMICPEIKYDKESDESCKSIIDAKTEFVRSLSTDLLRLTRIQLKQSIINHTLIIKYSISLEG